MENYDVIVVGGSVSGAPTATWLARRGYKVLVVERAIFPRDANSTHFIWPRGMSYLNRLGVADTLLEQTPSFTHLEVCIEGISLRGRVPPETIRDRFRQLHGNADGVVGYCAGPRRYFLDSVLLNETRRSGADVRENTVVKDLLYDGDKVCGVRGLDANGAEFEARAKIVIGADGRMSQFSDLVSAKKTVVREKSTFAYYGYFSGIDKSELAIHKRGRLGTAIFPTMEDRHLVLVYGPTAWWGDFSADAEANFFKTYEFVAPDIAAMIKRGRREEPFKAMGRMVAFHRKNWGNGWALVGDAGSFKDQWTAMGITHSLRDAELISEFIDQSLSGRMEWATAMIEYSKKREADYEDYWNFVCDGAECNPYTQEQLQYFYQISRSADHIDRFIAQVGDTLSLGETIPVADIDAAGLPAFIREYDAGKREYHRNPYAAKVESLSI